MKILMAHNRYLESGGEDISFRMEVEMLRRHGCDVLTYEEDNERIERLGGLRTAARSIWSPETFRNVRSILRETHCDIVHVQNFFPLISPSIYYAARAEGVPVVQSLRNYRLLCPTGTLNRNGKVCEQCLGRAFPWPAVRWGCYRDNGVASGVVGTMLAVNRAFGTWAHTVDAYIALTEIMRKKFVQGGLPADKVFVKSNFLHPDPSPGAHDGDFALFVGRLTPEKGVETLLNAWKQIGDDMPLKVVGAGPLESVVTNGACPSSVAFLGWRPEAEVLRLMGSARFVIIPTEWYEGQPRTAIEAFAKAAPVIASNIGAMAEMIDDGRSGLLFTPGNADELAAKVRWALCHGDELAAMGVRGRAEYERKYEPDMNYGRLKEIYMRAIASRRRPAARPARKFPASVTRL